MTNKSFSRRRSRVFLALFALTIAGCVFSGLLTLYYDINLKMNRELRAYGANVIISPHDKYRKDHISQAHMENIAGSLDRDKLIGVVPYLFTVCKLGSERVVLAGTWFDQARKVNPYWHVEGEWVKDRADDRNILAGYEVARNLGLEKGQKVTLSDVLTSKSTELTVKGIVKTGDQEENRIFCSLSVAQELSQKQGQINMVYLSIAGAAEELQQAGKKLETDYPEISVDLIRRISQSEGAIINKIRFLLFLITVIILLSTLLCVAATMLAMTLERRKEIGLKKALGAGNKDILMEFAGECLFLGTVGGMAGYLAGFMFIQIIGKSVFDSMVGFRPWVVPLTLMVSITISSLAAFLPIKIALGIEPAVVLKGE